MSVFSYAKQLCEKAQTEGRNVLLEHELYGLLKEGGIATPDFFVVPKDGDVKSSMKPLPGPKVVVKIESPRITHKTEAGGVKVCANSPEVIEETVKAMFQRVKERVDADVYATVSGVIVAEFVPNDNTLGSQLFLGMRYTPDMGHVLAMGFGGLEAEEYAVQFKAGRSTVMFSPELSSPEDSLAKFKTSYAFRKMTGATREAVKRCDEADFLTLIRFFSDLAVSFSNTAQSGFIVKDFEINPFFVGDGRVVAVDAFMRFEPGFETEKSTDLTRIGKLLKPRTAAIMGVSGKGMNVGRVILRNLLREGFETTNIRIVRPDPEPIDGVQCCPSIAQLPWTADLIVVAVSADQVPEIMAEVVSHKKAESVVLIPGGMGETEGGKEKERMVKEAIAAARATDGVAPVVVGPNCLGIRSRPGKYDTLFIPEVKLPLPTGGVANTALVSQSGAFMITRMNLIPVLDCPYTVSTGNQMDLTFTDFVEYLLDDPATPTIGIYIEGFKPLDGRRLARLIKIGKAKGKDFIVYKAGRTSEGAHATSSHTASISGDYASAVEILKDAGALVADTFAEFKDYMTLAGLLQGKEFIGTRLGAMSNAGYETVGIADNLLEPTFSLTKFSADTQQRIVTSLEKFKLGALVTPRNPLDLTPMAVDKAHAESVEAILDDSNVDAVVMGFVPFAISMRTLPPGVDPKGEDSVDHPEALPALLKEICAKTRKPLVTVVDSGTLYDALAQRLEANGIPCFRSSDQAMHSFQKFILHKMG